MRRVTLSKLDLFIIAAIIGGAFLIERGNRTHIGPPVAVDAQAVAVVACPANESVPFSPECMAFIGGGTKLLQTPKPLAAPVDGALADSPELPIVGR